MVMFDTIFFGLIALLGAILTSLILGFIFMVVFEIFSILIEETYNLFYDVASIIVWCIKWTIPTFGNSRSQ
jgi:predicted lipid-binding transport protein (Tim44 family)